MSDFFREVSEDVRRDRAVDLIKRFQWVIVAVVLIVVLGTAGWRYDMSRRQAAAEEAGGRYQAALADARADKAAAAEASLGTVAADATPGYRALAKLRAADLTAGKDDAAAIKAYDAIAMQGDVDQSLRDVARVRAAMLIAEGDDRAAIEKALTPLAAATFPYHASIRELLALTALKHEDYAAAGRWLDEIVTDPQAPTAIRGRAEAFLGIVGAAARSPPK